MLNRAWSQLTLKSVDDDLRILEGVASTPSTDRQDDIVEPLGAKFSLPLPFLWQHRSDSPIGHVVDAKATKDGIRVKVQLARTDEPGELKNLLDRAWQSIKLGLVRGLSIGFRPLDAEDIEGSWGKRFKSWEWLELSSVTIAANGEASISAIKAVDAEFLPVIETEHVISMSWSAQGQKQHLPGASGVSIKHKPKPTEGKVKTATEQITDLEATRAAKAARLTAVQNKANEESRTKNEAEKEEFDTLRDEIAAIDSEMVDLKAMESIMFTAAKPVETRPTTEAAAKSRDTRVIVEREEKLEPGIGAARLAMCLFAAQGNRDRALQFAKDHYPRMVGMQQFLGMEARSGQKMEKHLAFQMQMKANVVAGNTLDATWAGNLLAYNTLMSDFVEFLRAATIIGKFGNNGIPDLNRIPFNVNIKGQSVGGTGYWVGEGKAKPLTSFGFTSVYHGWYKVAAIATLTEEMIRFSDPSAERLVRNSLADVLIERIDTDFVDPAVAIVANVSPASITNGVAAIPSSGTDADAVRADIQALWAAAVAANLPATSAVYITTPSIAMALGLMTNAFGQPEFGGITMTGGSLLGVPLIVSNYVPAGTFILVFANEIWFSDDGQVTIDASNQASLQMVDGDSETMDSVTPTATSVVSMFQTDSVALRAHRFVNWSKRRATAVALLEDVGWGGAISS